MGVNNFQTGQNFCFYSYLSPRNGILVSAREKERREWGLGVWLYHPLPQQRNGILVSTREKERREWRLGACSTIPYPLPRNVILVSTREKERREWRLGAWLYHPLPSTEERDLGEHQREGTERVKTGGLALPSPTLYRGAGSWSAPERRNGESGDLGPGSTIPYTLQRNWILVSTREKERWEWRLGAWLYHPLHSTEERDLGEHQSEWTGEWRLEAWFYHPLHSNEERDLSEQKREGTERVKTGGLVLPSPTL